MAFLCDPVGIVKQVLRNDFSLEARLIPGEPWTLLMDSASLDKSLMFLKHVNVNYFAAGWELNVRLREDVTPLFFSGGRVEDHILIVGAINSDAANHFYEDEILAINNEQANLIRSLIKEKSILQHKGQSQKVMLENADRLQEIFLDDVAKLNNELVTLQRKLTKANHALEQKQHLLESILETMPDVLYTISLVDEKLLFTNRSINTVLGYGLEGEKEADSVFFKELLHPEDLAQLPERLERYKQAEDEAVIETEYRLKHVDGSWRWFRSRDTVFERDRQGVPIQVLGIAQDITVYKLLQEKLWSLSIHDTLTGLYNRTYFENELERLKNSRLFPVSVVMMDVNDLKIVNDKGGHAAGDELLQDAAEVFSKAFRTDDVVARVGGDEFAVLLPQTDADTVQLIKKRIFTSIKKHNQSRSHGTPLSLAIGCATAEEPGRLSDAIKQADEKLYANKSGIKNEKSVVMKTKKEESDALNR